MLSKKASAAWRGDYSLSYIEAIWQAAGIMRFQSRKLAIRESRKTSLCEGDNIPVPEGPFNLGFLRPTTPLQNFAKRGFGVTRKVTPGATR